MTGAVRLSAAAPAEALYAYLTDPTLRPQWQASLRRVADVSGGGEAGSHWVDVTALGARPRLSVLAADPPRSWTEQGRWRGLSATLRLEFIADGASRCELAAYFRIDGPGLWWAAAAVLQRLAGPAIAFDLRRAVRLAAGH